MKRERIDTLLVERGLAQSRNRAQALVMAGVVLVDEQLVNKPSEKFAAEATVRLKVSGDSPHDYVSRGGMKLEAALREFQIDVNGLTCLDIGSSTGGFTDCLLRQGARRTVALDVGHNQIDWRLRSDPRVEVREGINARYLKPEDFDRKFDLVTIDVAFISATKILPAIVSLLGEEGKIITLIKPQFEVGRENLPASGVVKDERQQQEAVGRIEEWLKAQSGWKIFPVIPSPILGGEGNREFLICGKKSNT